MDTRWKGLLVVRCLIFIFQSSKCDASTFGSHSEGRSWSTTSQPASRRGRLFWSLPGHNDVSSHVSGHEAACSPGDEEATCSPASRYNTTLHNAMQYLDTILQVPHHVRAVQQPGPPRVRGPGPAPASPPPAALRRPRAGDAPEPRGGRGPAARAQGGVAGEAGWGRGARIQLDICCRRCTWTRASRGRGATRCC